MNLSRSLIIAGAVIIGLGILFTAQSQSVLGPESSFMYRNPEWMINGTIIAGIGIAVVISGIIVGMKRKL
ncbi:MAG: hypothetical protein QXU32_12035 [Nitrososphaerales archaeon]